MKRRSPSFHLLKACALHSPLLSFLLIASCGDGGSHGPAGPMPPAGAESPVAVVMTTHDQKTLMAAQPGVSFSTATASERNGSPIDENTIIVDETQQYQTVDGFGAAFTDSSTYLLNQVATAAARDDAMNRLFTRNGNGIGLTTMRTTIGSSDMSRFHYTYDDMPPGQTDPTLANFSIEVDRADRIPIILQAKRLNPQMGLLASLWSPPAWMKTTGSLAGGELLPNAYVPYTNYFVKYLQAYQAEGITIDFISHQNEPDFAPHDYPGMKTNSERKRYCSAITSCRHCAPMI